MPERIIVDGANVAHADQTRTGEPRVENLLAVRNILKAKGYDPIIIVDAALRHTINDEQRFDEMLEMDEVTQAPAGTDADYFVLEMAMDYDAKIVSNDTFSAYEDEYSWIEERRVPLMIVDGNVQIHEPSL